MNTLRLNIGCGEKVIDGFVNIDNSPSSLLARYKPLSWLAETLGVLSEERRFLVNFYKENKISVDILRFPRVISKNNFNLIKQLKKNIIRKKKIIIQNPKLNFNFIYINDFLSACERCAKKTKKG